MAIDDDCVMVGESIFLNKRIETDDETYNNETEFFNFQDTNSEGRSIASSLSLAWSLDDFEGV